MVAGAGLPLNLSHFAEGRLAGASRRGAVLPEAARGEPHDVGVYRDLDGGAGGAVVWPAASTLARACSQVPGASWRRRCRWPGIQVPPRRAW